MSPAMAAGVADRLWDLGDMLKPVEAAELKTGKRQLLFNLTGSKVRYGAKLNSQESPTRDCGRRSIRLASPKDRSRRTAAH
jgi:hypothetical protein